jgi:hypothetical protein
MLIILSSMFLAICVVPMLMPPPQTNYLHAQLRLSWVLDEHKGYRCLDLLSGRVHIS